MENSKIIIVWLHVVNSLPNNKMLDLYKLKAFAGVKLNFAKMMISVCDRVKNIVGKGENAGNQHFLFFPSLFLKFFSFRVIESCDCVGKV